MKRLTQKEIDALRQLALEGGMDEPLNPPIHFHDYLKVITNLPESMRPPKPVRFVGKDWKL